MTGGGHDDRLCRHDLVWTVPPDRWSEGAPLGNGRVGAVVWVEAGELVVAVDANAFWDRSGAAPPDGSVTWTGFVAATQGGAPDWPEQFPVATPRLDVDKPTRLPASTVRLPLGAAVDRMRLCLRGALLTVDLAGGEQLGMRVPAGGDRVELTGAAALRDSPVLVGATEPRELPVELGELLAKKDYPPCERTADLFVQDLPDGGQAAVALARADDGLRVGLGYRRHDGGAAEAARAAATATAERHGEVWDAHWAASGLELDDPVVERLWARQTYLLGAATAPDGHPLSLQGPWSTPHRLPAWSNDFHFNVNVQMSYWPVASGGRAALLRPLQDYVRRAMPFWRELCRSVFGVDGAFLPHDADADGRPIYSWALPFFAGSSGPWLALQLHDAAGAVGDEAGRAEAAGWLAELAAPLLAQLEPGEDGRLHLPWGFSPEYVDVGGSWGPDATIDLEVLRLSLARLTAELPGDARHGSWAAALERLAEPAADDGAGALGAVLGLPPGGLRVRADAPLVRSHRHHSHLIAVHPFRSRAVDDTVRESLLTLVRHGHGEWVGFSLTWAAGIAHACSRPDLAVGLLRDLADDWLTGNGFQLQGSARGTDLTVWNELAHHLPDALTLEAGIGAAGVVQELLLAQAGADVLLCAVLPSDWRDLSFFGLAVPCGLRADAVVRRGVLVDATVTASRDVACTLVLPAEQPAATTLDVSSGATAARDGARVALALSAGDRLRLHLPGEAR